MSTFDVELLHTAGQLNLASDILSRQQITIASVSQSDEDFHISPLITSIKAVQDKDEKIQALLKQVRAQAGQPRPLPAPTAYCVEHCGLLKVYMLPMIIKLSFQNVFAQRFYVWNMIQN